MELKEIENILDQKISWSNKDEEILKKRKASILHIISVLIKKDNVYSLLWGGSHFKSSTDKYSDIDLYCLVANPSENLISKYLKDIEAGFDFRIVLNQGYFPWFGSLWTFFPHNDDVFNIDLGFISESDADSFFWDQHGLILLDKRNHIIKAFNSNEENKREHPYLFSAPFESLCISLIKLKKSLLRSNYWNAHEMLNQARRFLIVLLRSYYAPNVKYYGRPEREIEDVLSKNILKKLTFTTSNTQPKCLAKAAKYITNWSLDLSKKNSSRISFQLEKELKNLELFFDTFSNHENSTRKKTRK